MELYHGLEKKRRNSSRRVRGDRRVVVCRLLLYSSASAYRRYDACSAWTSTEPV